MKRRASTFSNLMDVVLTREDYLMARDELVVVYQALTAPQPMEMDAALGQVRDRMAAAIKMDWQLAKLEPIEYITEAVAYLDSVPTVELSLAFDPSLKLLARLVGAIREKARRAPVVSVSINPGIMGGMEVMAYGKYADLSLRRKIEGMFAEFVPGVLGKKA